jgi:hypothetical protein
VKEKSTKRKPWAAAAVARELMEERNQDRGGETQGVGSRGW